ncbi:hypothetical protein BYT27DRAFT_7107960 [Phlegmacium glaucopus]|nr:hypothetical protein BYT27DRAFT_7107960 [Phlegmacium glaucopus]
MQQLIQTHCQAAALRLVTIGKDHPLYKQVQKAARRHPKLHPSLLHSILQNSRVKLYTMENIDPKPKHLHPNWASKIQTRIAEDKEEACTEEETEEADIRIYTDGSGKNRKIGAAAVLRFGFCPRKTARHHLGSSDKHTVFKGECVGELLRLRLLHSLGLQVNLNRWKAVIGVDSQAAIQRLDQREGGASIIHSKGNSQRGGRPYAKIPETTDKGQVDSRAHGTERKQGGGQRSKDGDRGGGKELKQLFQHTQKHPCPQANPHTGSGSEPRKRKDGLKASKKAQDVTE